MAMCEIISWKFSDFLPRGYDVTVHPTSGPRDITQQIAQYGEAYDKIVSIGGDGTQRQWFPG